MKRYSAAILLFVMSCSACPVLRAQVLQIDADGAAHRIGPEWSEPVASRAAVGPQTGAAVAVTSPAGTPRTLQLVLDTGSGGLLQYDPSARLAAVHEYLAGNRDGHALPADETTLAKAGHAHIRDVNYDP